MSRTIKIAHLYPELLNLYGDSGNIITLQKRCAWRGIACEVVEVNYGGRPSFSDIDIAFIGGGSDREQRIVCEELLAVGPELQAYTQDMGVLLAVCGGYQLLGHSYAMGDETLRGLSIVDMYTDRGEPRLIGNVMIQTELFETPVVGYENHGGRTHLGEGVKPLGRVLHGFGNDGASGQEGVLSKNVVGTYIHGPLLPKNPDLADWLLARALERKGEDAALRALDDSQEHAANSVMAARMRAGEA